MGYHLLRNQGGLQICWWCMSHKWQKGRRKQKERMIATGADKPPRANWIARPANKLLLMVRVNLSQWPMKMHLYRRWKAFISFLEQ